jgi:F0F1-type ATP synthase assembly protein I
MDESADATILIVSLVVSLLVGGVFGFVGGSMAKNKGHGFGLGFVLGFFLGLLGIIILACMKDQRQSQFSLRNRRMGRGRPGQRDARSATGRRARVLPMSGRRPPFRR